ncbi:hypothetical protein CWO90_14975 [Bradyrhizobium sp. Leo121]|nr:hypothetical protein CWO90_14975 [Bradyrhizobium sp. Leo121]
MHTLLLAPSSAQAEFQQRVALIVGNGTTAWLPSLILQTSAADLEEAFLRIAFEVSRVSNADRSDFLQALGAFEDRASEADIASFSMRVMVSRLTAAII